MVDGKSPEWLPPGFSKKVKYKSGRKITYYQNEATGVQYRSKKEVVDSATAESGILSTPQKTNKDDNGLSSNKKVDLILAKTNDYPDWLPDGWTIEERSRHGGTGTGSVYKVYTESSSGRKFYSKPAVTRYLNTVDRANVMTLRNKLDKMDETSPDVSSNCVSMIVAGPPSENEQKLDEMDESSRNMSLSIISTSRTSKNKKKVPAKSIIADELPPGWIKEVKISKSGNKIRKDPFYTDPVSGYAFRSRLDALRYLKTNDIGSCAIKPKKRDELGDLELIKNEIPSSNAGNEKLPEPETQPLVGGELNGAEEGSFTKAPAESDSKILEQIPETKVSTAKSKKRRNSSLPSRTSKRLAGGQPDTEYHSISDERSLRAAANKSSQSELDTSPSFSLKGSASIPLPSDIVPAKEPAENSFKVEENGQEIEPPNKVEIPSTENPATTEERAGEKVNETQLDNGQKSKESQLFYDFGESWSDPLEFALKTLRGDISIEDTLTFPNCFSNPNGILYNQQNGCSKPSQSNAPVTFKNEEVVCHSESSKQNPAADKLPANPLSFSALGNISYTNYNNIFNRQPSTEVGKKNSQTKFNP